MYVSVLDVYTFVHSNQDDDSLLYYMQLAVLVQVRFPSLEKYHIYILEVVYIKKNVLLYLVFFQMFPSLVSSGRGVPRPVFRVGTPPFIVSIPHQLDSRPNKQSIHPDCIS